VTATLPAQYPALTGVFSATSERSPDRVLFRSVLGGTVTYCQAGSRAVAMAEAIDAVGLNPGAILLCYLDDTLTLGITYLACGLRGVLAAPLSPSFSIPYLKAMAEQLSSVHVLTTAARAKEVSDAGLTPLTYGDPATDCELLPVDEQRSPASIAAAFDAASHLTGADPLLIQPTSGSTGRPKQVVRRHAALVRYAHYVGDQLGEGPHRFLATAALTHAFGCHMYATALKLGAEVVMPRALDVGARIEDVRALSPTVMPMTPRVLRSLCRQYVFDAAIAPDAPLFGPDARFVLSAGGRSDPRLLRFVTRRGMRVIEFYGSSEASIVALTPRDGWREGWAGRLVSDVDAKIADDAEILLASPGMMAEYLGDPEQTRDAYDADGRYKTGDLGEIDSDGYLRILGRKKDVFNTPEGSNIHPERIEIMVEGLPWARQVILVGDQLPYVTALITISPEQEVSGREPTTPLSPNRNGEIYRRCGADLDKINDGLEEIERIRVFLLLPSDFAEDVYAVVGPAKVRRSRRVLAERYADSISWMYGYARLEDPSPTVLANAWAGATNAIPGMGPRPFPNV
jgi:long-chain acyl-CoA synthetase